jgi:hypothetical protein
MALGMIAIGYHCAIAQSRLSRVLPILAVSFSLVIALIATLDKPGNYIMPVPQRPLVDLLSDMKGDGGSVR